MLTLMGVSARPGQLNAQAPPSPEAAPVFKSGVDLVRVSAVVRHRKGRFVTDLSQSDFEVIDDGEAKEITDFRHDLAGVSVALLVDASGSMKANLGNAREAATHVLSWLDAERDEAAVFTFDTELEEIAPFGAGLRLPDKLFSRSPFGGTSLYDAIAQTAERVIDRGTRRSAVVVLTDGLDNASQLSASDVSGIASAIDVPVYVIWIVAAVDNPSAEIGAPTAMGLALAESLSDLANWTGGNFFAASIPAERSAAARQIVDELRHQYLIAFEASGRPGWHPLSVRVRDRELVVRARSGYFAGQPRMVSN
jgi:VWFA-related protein